MSYICITCLGVSMHREFQFRWFLVKPKSPYLIVRTFALFPLGILLFAYLMLIGDAPLFLPRTRPQHRDARVILIIVSIVYRGLVRDKLVPKDI